MQHQTRGVVCLFCLPRGPFPSRRLPLDWDNFLCFLSRRPRLFTTTGLVGAFASLGSTCPSRRLPLDLDNFLCCLSRRPRLNAARDSSGLLPVKGPFFPSRRPLLDSPLILLPAVPIGPLSRRPLLDPIWNGNPLPGFVEAPSSRCRMGVSSCQRNNQWASVLGRLSQERTSFEPWFLASLPVEAPYPRYNKEGVGQCWGISSLPFRAPTDRPGARPWTLWPFLPPFPSRRPQLEALLFS
jgi:hypothetical protein